MANEQTANEETTPSAVRIDDRSAPRMSDFDMNFPKESFLYAQSSPLAFIKTA